MEDLHQRLLKRIEESLPKTGIKNQFIKIKFSNFKLLTKEKPCRTLNLDSYLGLLKSVYNGNQALRLLGLGINFHPESSLPKAYGQLSLFSEADLRALSCVIYN